MQRKVLGQKRVAGAKTLRPFRLREKPLETKSRRYATDDPAWRTLREVVLHRHPLCVQCQKKGRLVPAVDVDHVDGDAWNNDEENLVGLCKSCHSRKTRTMDYGAFPRNLQPAAIPTIVVCGPSGSGKTTFCRKQLQPGDFLIDLDEIVAEIAKKPMYEAASKEEFLAGLKERNRRLRQLAKMETGRCFFIVSAPTSTERNFWRTALGAEEVIVIAEDIVTCEMRLRADTRRAHLADMYAGFARKWWMRYSEGHNERVIAA